ncbi:MAG: alpha/beta hydrolase [Phycisphaerales bacterium JB038]
MMRRLSFLLLLVIGVIMLRTCGTFDRLFFYSGPGPGAPPAGVEQVFFATDSGVQLHGWWTPAEGPPEQALGTVVHAHGNAMSVDNHHPITAFLAEYGFNVFIFDYRGYGRSQGKIRRREDALADLRAALAYVRTRADVDARRLALFGHSIGGALSLMAAPDEPDLAAIVAVSPFASWRGVAASAVGGGDPPNALGRFIARVLLRWDTEPIERLPEIQQCPILLLHGTRDEIVPYSHSQALLAAGTAAEVAVSLRTVEGGDHNNLPLNEPPLAEELAGWLALVLQGAELPPAASKPRRSGEAAEPPGEQEAAPLSTGDPEG